MAVQKTKIPVDKRKPEIAVKDFGEVCLGYSREKALLEAERCLMCKDRPCTKGCPVNIQIPDFIRAILADDLSGAYDIINNSNSLPAVCGRVCPQEEQCASQCVLGNKFEPVNIGLLERYVADNVRLAKTKPLNTGKFSVAVIGAGPAGLTFAGDMIKSGISVVIYEALHKAGGVLRYGIPEFRLPNTVIDDEIEKLLEAGVELKTNYIVGKTSSLEHLQKKHDAIFVAIGAGLPRFLNIPGENLNGVYSANEYLTRSNLMRSSQYPDFHTPLKVGKSVAVIGGGNVAMDAARTALRLGADKVFNIYRRSLKEMPARDEEIENALEEGVELMFLANPRSVLGDEHGNVKSINCIKMELGPPDESGRKRPIPVEGSEHEIETDVVVMAVGTAPNRVLLETVPELALNAYGYIDINNNTGQTSIEKIYAGGDIVTGSATVISAMGAARKAASFVKEYLYGKKSGQ